MANTHYDILEVSPTASQSEIKQAYRRLAKRFHPDVSREASHDRITQINAAYEILSDPRQRQSYDQQLNPYYRGFGTPNHAEAVNRQQRAAAAQRQYRQRQSGRNSDEQLQRWLHQVYQPVSRALNQILRSLQSQIDELAADPFDDELVEDFQAYIDDCREDLQRAQRLFRSMPNPSSVAGAAAHLYYCLDRVGDGLDELERFITSYDDYCLHTGQEMFRIAAGLRREAQAAMKEIA
ncbi:J domain-containing protein [Phormidium tenue FACHB-886]|nr:J domain-containing protein [Phormidium tenue FACHB-886]